MDFPTMYNPYNMKSGVFKPEPLPNGTNKKHYYPCFRDSRNSFMFIGRKHFNTHEKAQNRANEIHVRWMKAFTDRMNWMMEVIAQEKAKTANENPIEQLELPEAVETNIGSKIVFQQGFEHGTLPTEKPHVIVEPDTLLIQVK